MPGPREAALHETGEIVAGIAAGQLDESAIAAEIGEILLGRAPGRQREDEICVFKSTNALTRHDSPENWSALSIAPGRRGPHLRGQSD